MSFVKIVDPATGKVLYDSRIENLNDEPQGYISELSKLGEKCEGVAKENLEKIREAAIRRESREQEQNEIEGVS